MFLSCISKCTFPYQLVDYELHRLEVYELCEREIHKCINKSYNSDDT